MLSRKRMVGLSNVHWMDRTTSMVQLPRFHGSAFSLPSISSKSLSLSLKIPSLKEKSNASSGHPKSPFSGTQTGLKGTPRDSSKDCHPQHSNLLALVLIPPAHGSATFRWKHFNILASTLALPPNLRQKAEDFFNGLNHESATMHSRKRMVGLGNFHGWTRQLAWFSFRDSMVQLLHFHPSALKPRF